MGAATKRSGPINGQKDRLFAIYGNAVDLF